MRSFVFVLVTSAGLLSPLAAKADISFGFGTNGVPSNPVTVDLPNMLGSVGTFAGGAVYTATKPNEAVQPNGSSGNFYSVAPSTTTSNPQSSSPGVLTFTVQLNYVSFLWGSPDTYNTLKVTSNLGTVTVIPGTTSGLNFQSTNGDAGYAQRFYFQTTSAGEYFKTFEYSSSQNAFETGGYTVRAVPGPIAGAGLLPLLGLAGAWFARRRKAVAA